MENYFLIDGFNLSFRAFYAMPTLTTKDGRHTNAIHAFFSSIIKLSGMDTPHKTAVFFDKDGSRRHLEIYPEYKAQRSRMPDEMKSQMPYIRKLCELMGFHVVEKSGVEADDLLASYGLKLHERGGVISIVSADKDFAQIIRPKLRQLLPPQKASEGYRELDLVGVRTKFGVSPSQIPDFLALMGDVSDNIRGIEGVGPKTAEKWLKDFGNLEGLIRRADWIKPEKFRKVVLESKDMLMKNLKLVTLWTTHEVDLKEDSFKDPDFSEIIKFLEDLEMSRGVSIFKKFAKEQYQINL